MEFIKNNIKTVTAFIVGGIIFGGATAVLAAVISANQVTYNKTGVSGATKDTVQEAITELYGKANSLTSYGNATASQILSGQTALVNGTRITGTMTSKAAATYTPGTSNQTIASGQYLSGAQTIKGDSNLTAANIKSGVSIFGVTGTLSAGLDITALGWKTNSKKSMLASTAGILFKRRNGNTYFIAANNWEIEKEHIKLVFSDVSPDVDSSRVDCWASDFRCTVLSIGRVVCDDRSDRSSCVVESDGSLSCS